MFSKNQRENYNVNLQTQTQPLQTLLTYEDEVHRPERSYRHHTRKIEEKPSPFATKIEQDLKLV